MAEWWQLLNNVEGISIAEQPNPPASGTCKERGVKLAPLPPGEVSLGEFKSASAGSGLVRGFPGKFYDFYDFPNILLTAILESLLAVGTFSI